MMFYLITALACIEQVTGETIPLDTRFYAEQTNPGGSITGSEVSTPFVSTPGMKIKMTGVITSRMKGKVDLDFLTPDESQEGGVKRHGKLILDEPGVFEIDLPQNLGLLQIQAFQDLEADGPSESDPFAQFEMRVGMDDISDLKVELIPGSRSTATAAWSGATVPFSDHTGDKITISGVISSENNQGVDIDFRTPDPDKPGGMAGHGKYLLQAPGEFSFQIPKSLGSLELQVFQDLEADGPSGIDPFAELTLDIGAVAIEGLQINLVTGGRKTELSTEAVKGTEEHIHKEVAHKVNSDHDPNIQHDSKQEHDPSKAHDPGKMHDGSIEHVEIPPGTDAPEHDKNQKHDASQVHNSEMPHDNTRQHKEMPAGTGPEIAHDDNAEPDDDYISPFKDHTGDKIWVHGRLLCDGCEKIDLDFFQPDENSPGGRKMLGKMKLKKGNYRIEVPKNYGPIILEAFVDLGEDGPNSGDYMGTYKDNPVIIRNKDVHGINIELVIPEDGRMPMKEVDP